MRLTLGMQATEELSDMATQALVEGLDSPSLAELAGLPRGDVREARDLFLAAMEEFDVPAPQPPGDRLALARFIAKEIVDGSIVPADGAWLIGWHCWEPDRSASLAIFMGLASMCEDDPEHLSEYEQKIRREAHELFGRGDDNGERGSR